MKVPTIYKVYISGLSKGTSPENMVKNMILTYLHVWILKFLMTIGISSYLEKLSFILVDVLGVPHNVSVSIVHISESSKN